MKNNPLRFKDGRSDPYEFDEENGAHSSNNVINAVDYVKLNNSISTMKVYFYFISQIIVI